mgnify:CR=1 FL=1
MGSSGGSVAAASAARKRKLEEAFGKGVSLESEEGRKLLRTESRHAQLADEKEREKRDFLLEQLEKQEEIGADRVPGLPSPSQSCRAVQWSRCSPSRRPW